MTDNNNNNNGTLRVPNSFYLSNLFHIGIAPRSASRLFSSSWSSSVGIRPYPHLVPRFVYSPYPLPHSYSYPLESRLGHSSV